MTKFNRLFIFCSIILISFKVLGQSDTAILYQRAKFLVAAEHYISPKMDLIQFLNQHISVKELKASGFGKARFLLLEYRQGNTDDIPDSLFKINEVYYNCDYIIVTHSGLIFRLKGFLNNDFFSFMTEFSETSDIGYLLKANVFSLKNIATFKKKIFPQRIFIEDLDMLCLYKYYQAQKEADLKTNKLPCLGSCTIKDRKRPYQLK